MEIKTTKDYQAFLHSLNSLSEGEDFIAFQKRIIKTDKKIIGVKAAALRKLSKEIFRCEHSALFTLGNNDTFEEVLVKGLVLAEYKTDVFDKLYKLILVMDSWAEVDMILSNFKSVKYNEEKAFSFFEGLLTSDKEFVARAGVIGLMKYFLSEKYILASFSALNKVNCDKYYVNMGIAWLISEYLIKNPQNAVENMQNIIKNAHFNSFIINKSIQKARESFRIDNTTKQRLNELKIK